MLINVPIQYISIIHVENYLYTVLECMIPIFIKKLSELEII